MSRIFCGYNPPPPNFKTFFSEKYEDRLQRLPGFGKMRKSWESHKRPTLIVLHIFADDIGVLEKWMEMTYELADPDELGQLMDFFVDDVWAAYIFNEDDFAFFRGDEGCSLDAPPLIYGVTASGKVAFFGNTGPKTPNLENLKHFCRQLIEGKVEEPSCRMSQVEHAELLHWSELIYGSDEDVAVLFYNSLQNGTEANDTIRKSLSGLGDCLKQEAVRLFQMDLRGGSAPKKFSVESTPAFFFMQGAQKHNPIKCKYNLNKFAMLRFVAENATEELICYSRRGHRRLHAELLAHMTEYFDLKSNKQ